MNKNTRVYIVILLVIFVGLVITLFATTNNVSKQDATMTTGSEESTTIIKNDVESSAPKIQLESVPVLFPEVDYETPVSYWGAFDHKGAVEYYIDVLNNECNSGKYTDDAVAVMKQEIHRLEEVVSRFEKDFEKFERWDSEHYYASQVWQYFRRLGFSEEVTAGIIGNMMVETSGGTLDLKPTIYDGSRGFYGLCQWSLYYKPYMADTTFEYQLEFLLEDMPVEFKTFGFCYRKGFTYEGFLELETPEDAAIAFAKVYERCATYSYGPRKQAARTAYNYFVGE